ncbi:MAG: fumarylacetoacetate hydrolase family protein [Pseudomonadota bacterium]
MKFGTVLEDGRPTVVVGAGTTDLCRLTDLCDAAGVGRYTSTLDLVERVADVREFAATLTEHVHAVPHISTDAVEWLPPIARPSKILGVAFNNRKLVETAHKDPGVPNFFLKPPSALQAHRKPIRVNPDWGAVIPEPELCAVIGRRCKDVTDGEALAHVFGYAIHNDVTSHGLKFQKDSIAVTYDKQLARPEFFGWRRAHGEDDRDMYYVYHTRSKGTDTFGPMGPWITTRDEVPEPDNLTVEADLDGELFAIDSTANYRFSVAACIAEASRYFTLEPGDILSFGTTAKGQGRFVHGHKSVLLGEISGVIGISIEPLGRLENPIEHIHP